MFPDVDGKKGLHSIGQRRFGISRFDHFELFSIFYQPSPTTAELGISSIYECIFTGLQTSEGSFNLFFESLGQLPAAIGS